MTQPQPPSTPRWVQLPERTIRPTRAAAGVATACAVALLLASVVQTVLSFDVARSLAPGDVPDIARSAPLQAYDVIGGGCVFVAGAAAWISTCAWLWRARSNAEAISTMRHARSRPWIWLSWGLPIVSAWFPRQVVRDIHRASHPGLEQPPGLNLWWGLVLLTVFAAQSADNIALTGDLRHVDLLGWLNTVATLALLASLGAWLAIVRRIVLLQEAAVKQLAGGTTSS